MKTIISLLVFLNYGVSPREFIASNQKIAKLYADILALNLMSKGVRDCQITFSEDNLMQVITLKYEKKVLKAYLLIERNNSVILDEMLVGSFNCIGRFTEID